MRFLALVAATLVLPGAAPASAETRTHVIVIDHLKFGPSPTGVKVGDVILWDNRDMFRHTATASNGAFNIDLQPGAKGKTIIRRAGAISFLCKYHPGMRGMLKVAAK